MTSNEENDQRRAPRVSPFIVPCRMALPNGRQLSGYLTDLSALGAQVSCDGPPPAVGVRIVIEVQLRRSPAWPSLAAEIKWTRAPRHDGDLPLCGLTFVDVEAHGRALIETAIADFRCRAAQLGQGQP